MDHVILPKLDASRRELLDSSLRNPLINFRYSKARSIRIVDERSTEVFRILVKESRAMAFLPSEQEDEDPALGQPEAESELASRHTDTNLQTALGSAKLQSTLLNIHYTARTFLEEQGVNLLYLALGMLAWREREEGEARLAPLVLVPVELSRTSAQDRFRLRYTGDELGENLSLQVKLENEQGLAWPALPEAEDLDLAYYFEQVRQAIADRPGWQVRPNDLALGFFSFGKFLMYRDLDPETWPQEAKPTQHPILRALLADGFKEPPSAIQESGSLDQLPEAVELPCVVEADSSQITAILDAQAGRNLVIQGPPGTGKSQTITNLIADAIRLGKRVLFVSEKMAALEVVKRRLDRIGLGDACLELHSHKANKKALLAELERTLNLGAPRHPAANELGMLAALRERLNRHAEALNTPVGRTGITPYQAMGELLQLRTMLAGVAIPRLDTRELHDWTPADAQRRLALVAELELLLKRMGLPLKNPFWGSKRSTCLPSDEPVLKDAIAKLLETHDRLREIIEVVRGHLPLPVDSRDGLDRLLSWCERLESRPSLEGLPIASPDWLGQEAEFRALLTAGKRLAEVHARMDAAVIPEAWQEDLGATRRELAAHGGKWYRFLIGSYRKARNHLAGLCHEPLPRAQSEVLAIVDALLEGRRLKASLDKASHLSAMLGDRWKGKDSDWSALESIRTWLAQLHRDLPSEPHADLILRMLEARPVAAAMGRSELYQAQQDYLSALALAETLFEQDAEPYDSRFEAVATRWRARLAGFDQLHDWVLYQHLEGRLAQEGLQALFVCTSDWEGAGSSLVSGVRQAFYTAILDEAFSQREALGRFEPSSHEQARTRFCELDQLSQVANRVAVARYHHERIPRLGQGGGQLGIIARELQKRARHLPIRQLMAKAGQAVQAIKPVFMMSPMSIATFLPPGALEFDLVVFDEASQVKPVDALGALLRGRQVVVVGDKQQMPPTSFFDRIIVQEDEDSATSDVESILTMFEAQGAPSRMLRWHYRSQHESLIAVSNREFYGGGLEVFPSPDAGRYELGLKYHHLPHTVYKRGEGSINPEEARMVAKAVMEHAKRYPKLSLGVVAFSLGQQQAIQEQVELLRRQDASCEAFFAENSAEPFFVKNLESVQGDERHVIFISIGYGRDDKGQVAMNFGPLNRDGGERRLNVLISRARLRCEVFTNLDPEDVRVTENSPKGLRSLRVFLTYAKTGTMPEQGPLEEEAVEPFEAILATALTQAGYQVRCHVGAGGFSLNVAVCDPRNPDRYLLGIACDGPGYREARSARDRDRLREMVLKGLNWRLHRIWIPAWFRQPEAELARLLQAIETAMIAEPEPEVAPVEPVFTRDEQAPEPVIVEVAPYRLVTLSISTQGQELHTMPLSILGAWVTEVVETEGPIHESEVAARITQALGTKRGKRISERLDQAMSWARQQGRLSKENAFLAMAGREVVLRDRSGLSAALRKVEMVAPAELCKALMAVLMASRTMEDEVLLGEVVRLLGLSRPNEDGQRALQTALEALLVAGEIERAGTHLRPKAVQAGQGSAPARQARDVPDYYAVLGLSMSATQLELQDRFVKLSNQWRMRKNAALTPEARQEVDRMEGMLTEIRRHLLDSERRRAYDASLCGASDEVGLPGRR